MDRHYLGAVIGRLYPAATLAELRDEGNGPYLYGDYMIQNSEEGLYIAYWNEETLGSRPTEEQLEAEFLRYLREQKVLDLLKEARASFVSHYQEVEGTYESMTLVELWEFAMAHAIFTLEAPLNPARAQEAAGDLLHFRQKREAVQSAASPEGVEAVGWNSP